ARPIRTSTTMPSCARICSAGSPESGRQVHGASTGCWEWSDGKYAWLPRPHILAVVSANAETHIPEPVVMGPRFRGDDSCTSWSTGFRINGSVGILDARFREHDEGMEQEQKARLKWRNNGSASS